jgi:Tol biopolymer transport system component
VSDGGDLRRVTTPPDGGFDTVGDVSPDGGRVAFLREGDLFLVNADGTGERLLAEGDYGGAAWSPDGASVLTDLDGSLFLIDPDEGTRRELTSDSHTFRGAYAARWSPDGTHISFSMKRPGPYADIWVMNVDGTGLQRLTRSPATDNEVGNWAR